MASTARRALRMPSSWKAQPAQAPQRKTLPPARPWRPGSARCARSAAESSTGWSSTKRCSVLSSATVPSGAFSVTKTSVPSGAAPGCSLLIQ